MSAGERKAGFPNQGEGGRSASYGMTQKQLENHRKDQKAGTVKMVEAIPGRKGQKKEDAYMVPKIEFLHHYHVEVEIPHHDAQSGERMDRGKWIVKYPELAYAQALRVNAFAGKRVEVIHDPTMAQDSEAKKNAKKPFQTKKDK